MRRALFASLLAMLTLSAQMGCRGYTAKDPPIHLNPNMDVQAKGKPYRASDFFEDGSYMRPPIEGTIARGHLKDDEHFYFGTINGEPAQSFPAKLTIDEKFLMRGRQVFDRTCAACHAHIGNGDGLVGRRLLVKPTSLHSDYMYGLPPGHFFKVIGEGVRTMQPIGRLFTPTDKWAVVAYVRSLQMSQDIEGEWIKRSASWWKQK